MTIKLHIRRWYIFSIYFFQLQKQHVMSLIPKWTVSSQKVHLTTTPSHIHTMRGKNGPYWKENLSYLWQKLWWFVVMDPELAGKGHQVTSSKAGNPLVGGTQDQLWTISNHYDHDYDHINQFHWEHLNIVLNQLIIAKHEVFTMITIWSVMANH